MSVPQARFGLSFVCKISVPVAMVLVTACGGKSGETTSPSPETSTASTQPGPGGTPAAPAVVISGQLLIESTADTATAFPISSSGKITHSQAQQVSSAPIQAGALAIGIASQTSLTEDPPSGHVVVVYDSKAGDRFAQGETMRFVSMPVEAEGLIALPTGDAIGGKIEFGTVTESGGELVSEKEASGGTFSTAAKELETVSTVDNSVRMAKNALMNTTDTSYLNASIGFVLRTVHGNDLDGAFAAPTHNNTTGVGMPEYVGYGFRIDGVHPDLQTANICGSSRKTLEFIPPSASTSNLMSVINEHDLEAANPKKLEKFRTTSETANSYTVTEGARSDGKDGCFHNATATYNSISYSSWVTDISSFAKTPEGREMIAVSFGGNDLVYGPIRQGVWDLKVDSSTVAKFDLGVADPMTTTLISGTTYKYPGIFIPQVRLVLNDNKSVKKILLRLYTYKFNAQDPSASSFEVVTDKETLKRVLGYISVDMYGVKRGSSASDKSASVTDASLDATLARLGSDGTLTFEDSSFAKFYLLRTADAAPTDDNSDVEDGPYLATFIGAGYEMFGNTYGLRGKLDCDHLATPGPWKCQF
jgi:hypothetical protein